MFLARPVSAAGRSVVAVLKGCQSEPRIAERVLRVGFQGLADSRVQNLRLLRESFPTAQLTLLRQPQRGDCALAVTVCDRICVSSAHVLPWLEKEASGQGRHSDILVIVEYGDGRDGVLPEALSEFCRLVEKNDHLRLAGVLGNMGCEGGVPPSPARYQRFLAAVDSCVQMGVHLDRVSCGNSASIPDLLDGSFPRTVNEVRFGEALLLGSETADGRPIPGGKTDAFKFQAEVLEVADKSLKGSQERRVVIALGRADIGHGQLVPVRYEEQEVAFISSDHLVLIDRGRRLGPGEIVEFVPTYFALLGGIISEGVEKSFIDN